jgi:spore coat polysaccharide biosynthesis protein SpsF (cytidylyltransferase family)
VGSVIPPLAIIQARFGSARLPGKVLLPVGGVPLVEIAWRSAVEAFGRDNVVVAYPSTVENMPLSMFLASRSITSFGSTMPEDDLLARYLECASYYRTDPTSVIVRITPDDFRRDVESMRRVANGENLPMEMGGEAFTLAQLTEANRSVVNPILREHITFALFAENPHPPAPAGLWEINTVEDYELACKMAEGVA